MLRTLLVIGQWVAGPSPMCHAPRPPPADTDRPLPVLQSRDPEPLWGSGSWMSRVRIAPTPVGCAAQVLFTDPRRWLPGIVRGVNFGKGKATVMFSDGLSAPLPPAPCSSPPHPLV